MFERRNMAGNGTKLRQACVLAVMLVLLAPPHPAPAETGSAPPLERPVLFDRWTTDNGLPQSSVNAIVQTADGYLWFTTFDGLVRYDGVRFTVFNTSNTEGLLGNRFLALSVGRDGTLWVGGEDGMVYAFGNGRVEAYTLANSTRTPISALRETPDGLIWIQTSDTVYQLDRTQFVARVAQSTGDLAPGGRGGLAWKNGSTLTVLGPDGPRTVGPGDGLPQLQPATHFSQDQKGRALLCTPNGEAFVVEDGRVRRAPFDVPVRVPVDSMPFCKDSRGNFWVGYRESLFRMPPSGRLVTYGLKDGFDPAVRVFSIFEDREGNIWIGSDGGLYRFRGDLISTISASDGLAGNNTNVVLEDRAGAVWIGGDGFLSRYRDGAVTQFAPRVRKLGRATALLEDRSGGIWVGARADDYPIFRVVGDHIEPYPSAGITGGTLVNVLFEDRDGRVWVGTSARLARLRPEGGFDVYTTAEGLATADIRAIADDPSGGMWVGGYGGLSRIVNGSVVPFPGQEAFAGEQIRALHPDENGVLWVGTYDRGLFRYENGQVTRFGKQTGLFSEGVFTILEDGAGYFWMSCNTGIFRVSKRQLDEVAKGTLAGVNSVAYGRDDGMVRSECNGGKQPSASVTRDGRFLFASQGGVVVVDPRVQPYNTEPPPVLIEGAATGATPLPLSAELRIEPGVDSFEISYSSPSFVKPDLVRFRYRLEGLEETWVDAGSRRSAYFTYVPPGQYTFLVMAANCDGVWSETPARLSVVVVAPFWRTWLALILYAILLAGLVLGAVRLRTQQLRRRSLELEGVVALRTAELARKADELSETVDRLKASERKALEANRAKSLFLSNMSHELRTPLNALLGFAQLMDRNTSRSSEDRESLDIIHRSGQHLLGLINDVLSIAKIEAGKITLADEPFDFRLLLRSVEGMMQARAEAKGLQFAIDLGEGLPEAVSGDEGKLRQVLVNLLGNAVKFTREGRVMLRVCWDGDGSRARFEVEDTGPGISEADLEHLFEPFVQTETGVQAKEGTGLGLTISRQLVRLMGGDIQVSSRVGEGTTFRFDVPLGPGALSECIAAPRRVVGIEQGQRAPRVLVVDDTRENRTLLVRLLASTGFEVREAANGAEGVTVWREWRPDVVWMDMRMPVMDGHDAIRAIREAETGNSDGEPTRIIALTASAFDHQRDEILAIGADDFVPKPFREDEIFQKLARYCGVRYVYEVDGQPAAEGATPTKGRDFSAIPESLVIELRDALLIGDGSAAMAVTDRMREFDEPLSRDLAAGVRQFDFENILRLIEGAIGETRTDARTGGPP